jgi:hypothetical protein
VNNFDILDFINIICSDIPGNLYDFSGNCLINRMIYQKNLHDLSENLIDFSGNVKGIKDKNCAQRVTILGHSLQIQRTNTIAAMGTLLGTTFTATGTNTAAIATLIAIIGIPSVAGGTPSTGLHAALDSKTSRSLLGSGNIAIYGLGP